MTTDQHATYVAQHGARHYAAALRSDEPVRDGFTLDELRAAMRALHIAHAQRATLTLNTIRGAR